MISTMDLASIENQGLSFFGFLWRFSFISLLGVGMFFGMRKVLDYLDEKSFIKPRHEDYSMTNNLNEDLMREEYEKLY